MSWVKLDDGFFRHPKARAVGKDGRALFLAGLCHSATHLTDGVLPKSSIPLVAAEAEVRPAVAKQLVTAGLWHDRGDHYVIHQYLERNWSREKVEKERERWRRNKRGSTAEQPGEHTGETAGESTVESRRPGPTSPKGLKNSHSGGGSNLPPAAAAALDLVIELRHDEDERAGKIKSESAWRRSVPDMIREQHATTLLAHLAEHPDASEIDLGEVCGFDSDDLRWRRLRSDEEQPA